MEIRDVSFAEIPELLGRVSDKYGDYLSFNFTSGINREGVRTFKWNVYTSVLNHNDFDSREKFISFIENILHQEPLGVLEYRLAAARDKKLSILEDLESVEQKIKELEARVKDSGAIIAQQTQARLADAPK